MDLQVTFDQARGLDIAQKNYESYQFAIMPTTAATSSPSIANITAEETIQKSTAVSIHTLKCFFCGYSSHPPTVKMSSARSNMWKLPKERPLSKGL